MATREPNINQDSSTVQRVSITYDLEAGGALEKKELPLAVGVLANLTGRPEEPLPLVGDRKFVEIDRDNFDYVLRGHRPHLAFKVDNKLVDRNN